MPPPQDHSYPTRRASSTLQTAMAGPYATAMPQQSYFPGPPPPPAPTSTAPPSGRAPQKLVTFQLLLSDVPHHRARLPLRVNIAQHDTTESIITTVKNFFGLYEGEGVSFQDSNGITLIAQYENLEHNAIVHVRIMPEPAAEATARMNGYSPRKARLGEPFQMLPPQSLQPISRPNSRASKLRSASPSMRRSMSARPPSKSKARTNGRSGSPDNDAANGLSDSDAGSVSVTSSRREPLASAEISLDNIVEGGRRKRAKFESSELPLFAPPQQPSASISSMSPQRRPITTAQSPINPHSFGYSHPLPSPQSLGKNEYITAAQANLAGQQARPRGRTYSIHGPSRLSGGSTTGLLPTPDPTIGSVISDEDVALQLMRLGDATNYSHGRISTSTMDETLSGKADMASSAGETDVESLAGDVSLPPDPRHSNHGHARKKLKAIDAAQAYYSDDASEDEYDDVDDGSFRGSDAIHGDGYVANGERARSKSKPTKPRSNSTSVKGIAKPRVPSLTKAKSKSSSGSKIPPSPYAVPPGPVRKASSASTVNTSYQAGGDEDDLSSKPRCQRCRKSKKGCDRQRPCQRCKDAGIGIEGCISEDEGNGRKGRYGRHMGVAIKRESMDETMSSIDQSGENSMFAYSPESFVNDANKKRKRTA